MKITTLYYLEITPADIQASKNHHSAYSPWCRSCPVSQAMKRTLDETCQHLDKVQPTILLLELKE